MSETLADELKRLCCAETEGKFFDCVTDNIDAILSALRSHDALVKALQMALARIEYLGAACTDPRHFQNNVDVMLPMIDAALRGDVGGSRDVDK